MAVYSFSGTISNMSKAGAANADETNLAGEWLTASRFAALLGVFIAVFFPAILFGGHTFVFRDFGVYSYPVAFHLRESIWNGEIPLWNALNDCGTPFMAQWSTMVFYPLSLFYILLPISWALGAFCLLHLFGAGMGMYFLAHRWTGDRLAAGVAGLTFAFSGMVLSCLIWPHYMVFFAWMPFVFWTTELSLFEGGRKTIWAIFAGTMQMLSGMPEFIVLTWLMIGLLWLGRCLARELSWRSIFRFFLIVAGITSLSAIQLLPFFELLRHSHRGEGFGDATWSVPASGVANLLVPLFGCYKSLPGIFMQATQQLVPSYYLTLPSLALAIVAVCRAREWKVRLFAVATVFSFLIAMGNNTALYPTLKDIFPVIGLMRYPVKFVLPLLFFVSLLAAFGIRELYVEPNTRKRSSATLILIVWLVLSTGIFVALWFAHRSPVQPEFWPQVRNNSLTRFFILTVALLLLHYLPRLTDFRRHVMFCCLLLALLWIDGITHTPRQNLSVPSSLYAPGVATVQNMKPRPAAGETRARQTFKSVLELYKTILSDPVPHLLCRRLALTSNVNLLDQVPKTTGFYSLHLHNGEALRSVIDGSEPAVLPIVDFMCVSQMSNPADILAWEPHTNYMPLVASGQKPVFHPEETLLASVCNQSFDPRTVVHFSERDRNDITATNGIAAKILSQEYSTHRIELETEASAAALLTISQSHYPAWKAYIDGNAIPIYRANYAFQALEVPAGRHHLKLVYEDRQFRIGAASSGVTLLACLGYLSLAPRKRSPVIEHG